jgi:hypothetical protein
MRTIFAFVVSFFVVGACTGEPATDTNVRTPEDTNYVAVDSDSDPTEETDAPEGLETDLDPVGETDPPDETDLIEPEAPVDTDTGASGRPPWVDTDPPPLPLEQQSVIFTQITDCLFPPGSFVPGWSAPGEGVVESHWATCTKQYPGEDPEATICLFYNKMVTGEVGLIRRFNPLAQAGTCQWELPASGIGDMVAARMIDGPVGIYGPATLTPGPKLHQLRFAQLPDSTGVNRTVLLIGASFGPVLEPDPAQLGTWRQELTIRDALMRDLGIAPAGFTTTWDVDTDGRLDLVLMKDRKVDQSDLNEPTGLVVLYSLPTGDWQAVLAGAVGGHNDVYAYLFVGEPGAGPPMIAALGSDGPSSTQTWEARDSSGQPIFDADGHPIYAMSSVLGTGLGPTAPMGATLLDLGDPTGLPAIAIATAASDLCHKIWKPMFGQWWESITSVRRVIAPGTPDARAGKCTWDTTLVSREIPWGMVVLTPDLTWTVWGHDTTQDQQCGLAAMAGYALRGQSPPTHCPPMTRPTVHWTDRIGGGNDQLVAYPAAHLIILDQAGRPVPDRNDRHAQGWDLDLDGDADVLVSASFESEAHALQNEATGPRFCVQLHGAGPATGNNELGLGAKITVIDRTTGEAQHRWVDHGASCFAPPSRDPYRTEIRLIWPNGRIEPTLLWDGQSSTVPFTE